MAEANNLASSQNYVDAKMKYSEASAKKPNEQLPKDKMAEMQLLIDEQASSVQSDALYTEYMLKGNKEQNLVDTLTIRTM